MWKRFQPPPWAADLVSVELGTNALPLSVLLNSTSWSNPPPRASVRFRAVPWGNFDLERMRVTELAAAQGRAVSLRPGLGCPCHLPAHWDTRQSLQGSGDTEGIFPAFFPRWFSSSPFAVQSLVPELTHPVPLAVTHSFNRPWLWSCGLGDGAEG